MSNKTLNSAAFHQFPVLHTERLVLNDFDINRPTDIETLFNIRSLPEVVRYMDRDPLYKLEEAAAQIENQAKMFAEQTGIQWAMRLREAGQIIGFIGIFFIDNHNCRAHLGYALLPEYWKQGLVQEAGRAVIAFGRDCMQLHSMEATINPANEASRKTLLRLGFEKESYKRQDYQYTGRFLDSEGYGLVLGNQV